MNSKILTIWFYSTSNRTLVSLHIKWTLIHPKTCRLPAAPPPHSKTAIPQLLDLKELMNLTSFEGMSLYLRLPTNPDPGTKRL